MVYMNAEKMIASSTYHPHVEESISTLKFPHPAFEKDFYLNQKIYQALLFCSIRRRKGIQRKFPAFEIRQMASCIHGYFAKRGFKSQCCIFFM